MATLFRIVLWLAWAVGVGWLWRIGLIGSTAALTAATLGLVLLVRRSGRRRRGELRYVNMGKQPVGAP